MDTPKVAPSSGGVEQKVEEKYQKNNSSLQHNCNIAACSTGPYTTSYIKGNRKGSVVPMLVQKPKSITLLVIRVSN